MKNLKLLWRLMEGNRLLYAGSIAGIGLATLISITAPLVIRLTLDSIIGDKALAAPEWVIKAIDAMGGTGALSRNLWICGLCLVLLTVLNGIFLYLKGRWSAAASESIARNIRERLYSHLQSLPYDEQVKAKTGDLVQRCSSDVETVRSFLAIQLVEMGRAVFMTSMIAAVMLSLDVRLSLVAMAIIPGIFAFAVVFFFKVKKAFQLSDEAEGRLSTVLQENLSGVRVVRAFARQEYEQGKYDEKNREFRDLTYRLFRLLAWYWSFSDMMCMLQIGAVLIVGSYWSVQGTVTLGTLVVFTTYEGMLLWPIRQMGRILTDMGKALVSVQRIQEVLDTPAEPLDEGGLRPEIHGRIEFKDVSFSYSDGREILSAITFTVEKGQTVSIMGPTGSGKTTLVNLLLKLYDYTSGSIRLDGVELRDIDRKWLRRKVGYVAQEPFLFSKSIRENLSLAKPQASQGEIYEAAQTACVHNVILEFEKGYETMVGEKGVTLSGGQKQRATIARTVLNDYPVLIFDDSLSSVDAETDASIRSSLKKRSRDVTTFIIAHRITTLMESDRILVLDRGRLVQHGTHEELINRDGLYKRIWSIQNELEQDLEGELRTEQAVNE